MRIGTRIFLAAAAAVLLHGTAEACELACVQTATASEITGPAAVTFDLEVSCITPETADGIASLSSSFELPAGTLLPEGTVGSLFPIGDPGWLGIRLDYGVSALRRYTAQLDYESCKLQPGAVIAPDGTVTVHNVVTGMPWVHQVAFECSTPIVCRPPATGTGATRTIGFWKTHLEALERCIEGGVDLGFGALTRDQALGILWANPGRYEGLQKATILLGRQLLAASCNVSQFGASPADFSIAGAVAAISARDCGAMAALYPTVDAFNNQNDNVALPFDVGSSIGVGARELAGDPGLPAGTCAP